MAVRPWVPFSTPRTFRRGLALGGAGARHHGMVVGGWGAATVLQGAQNSGLLWRPGLTMAASPLFPHTLSLGNVLKELSDPAGAVIYTSRFQVGVFP